jgi:hypothetical protein
MGAFTTRTLWSLLSDQIVVTAKYKQGLAHQLI